MNERPLCFLDVDGVLNRFGFRSVTDSLLYEQHIVTHERHGRDFSMMLDPEDAVRIERLAEHFDLAWATTWEHQAVSISALIGVDSSSWPVATRAEGEFAKLPGVLRIAQDRPFVWIDDDLILVTSTPDAPRKIIMPRTDIGLDDAVVDSAIRWATELKEGKAHA